MIVLSKSKALCSDLEQIQCHVMRSPIDTSNDGGHRLYSSQKCVCWCGRMSDRSNSLATLAQHERYSWSLSQKPISKKVMCLFNKALSGWVRIIFASKRSFEIWKDLANITSISCVNLGVEARVFVGISIDINLRNLFLNKSILLAGFDQSRFIHRNRTSVATDLVAQILVTAFLDGLSVGRANAKNLWHVSCRLM